MLNSSFLYGPPLCVDLRFIIANFMTSLLFIHGVCEPSRASPLGPERSSRTYHVSQKQSKGDEMMVMGSSGALLRGDQPVLASAVGSQALI